MPPDPSSRHTRLRVRERAFVRYYHPATTMFSPPQLKILYETLQGVYEMYVRSLASGGGLYDCLFTTLLSLLQLLKLPRMGTSNLKYSCGHPC